MQPPSLWFRFVTNLLLLGDIFCLPLRLLDFRLHYFHIDSKLGGGW